MYRIKVEQPAKEDFNNIITYITETLDAPVAALSFMDEVEACYVRIQGNPYLYESCREPRLRERGYRRAVIGNYIMVYKPLDEVKVVEVHRFFYGPQNYIELI